MEHLYISYSSLTKKTNPLFEEKLEMVRSEMSKDRFKKMPGEWAMCHAVLGCKKGGKSRFV